MELSLSLQGGIQVLVACDGLESHLFDLATLIPDEKIPGRPPQPLLNPINYGQTLFSALFPLRSPAQQALRSADRLTLVLDNELETISWEYLCGPDGFLALEMPVVRLLQPGSRQPVPDLSATPLQVLAVPSNPISREAPTLNIVGEWRRLREEVEKLPHQIHLDRVNPPTLDNLRSLTLTRPQSIIHFMGHGGQEGEGAVLLFENDAAGVLPISARDLALSVRKHAFMVTLNACVSATPGKTEFSNLARLLVDKGLPYSLGMSASIPDDAALTFSRALYTELANGVEAEEAVFQARRSLLRGEKRTWLVGVPVLYSSLETPCAGGFATPTGQPRVNENRPRMEVSALPRAEGTFQGRVDELLQLGQALTGEPRTKLLTIHGMGGQGKTALAREAAERFAHAWPGGVWAVSLENTYTLDRFTLELARLFKIDLNTIYKHVASTFPELESEEYQNQFQQELERHLLTILDHHRNLLVLDNAETFMEAIDAKNAGSIDLAIFLREKVLGTQTSLLITSRNHLGWPGEQLIKVDGLSPEEGARLFWQGIPGRHLQAVGPQAHEISRKVEGHPLSLRLLGGAFDASTASLEEFLSEIEAALLQAEDKYKHEDHRHRTLFASIETSVRYLTDKQKRIFSGLWIFHSSFEARAIAEALSMLDKIEPKAVAEYKDQVKEIILKLAQRGLLTFEVGLLENGPIVLFHMPSTIRLFAHNKLPQVYDQKTLEKNIAFVYGSLIRYIYDRIDKESRAAYLMMHCFEDLVRCLNWLSVDQKYWYQNWLGYIQFRIGNRHSSLSLLEGALEECQDNDKNLEVYLHNNLGQVHLQSGYPLKAISFFEKALIKMKVIDDISEKASIYLNIATAYRSIGKLDEALSLSLSSEKFLEELGDREGQATALTNIGEIYRSRGQTKEALEVFENALNHMNGISSLAGEANVLNNIGETYRMAGLPKVAIKAFEIALPKAVAVNDRASETSIINNLGLVYYALRDFGKALEFLNIALQKHRELGNPLGEAISYNNIATTLTALGDYSNALMYSQRSALLHNDVYNPAGEANAIANSAFLFYSYMGNPKDAIISLTHAINILQQNNLSQDSSGVTLEKLQYTLSLMQSGAPITMDNDQGRFGLSVADIRTIINNTIVVLTDRNDMRSAWIGVVSEHLIKASVSNMPYEIDFLESVINIISGKLSNLPREHPYFESIQTILQGISERKNPYQWL